MSTSPTAQALATFGPDVEGKVGPRYVYPKQVRKLAAALGGLGVLEEAGIPRPPPEPEANPAIPFLWTQHHTEWSYWLKSNFPPSIESDRSFVGQQFPQLSCVRRFVWLTGDGQLGVLSIQPEERAGLAVALNHIVKKHSWRGALQPGERFLYTWQPENSMELLSMLGGSPREPIRLGCYSQRVAELIQAEFNRVVGPGSIKLDDPMGFSAEEKRIWQSISWTYLTLPEKGMGAYDWQPEGTIPDEYRWGVKRFLPKRIPRWIAEGLEPALLDGPVFSRVEEPDKPTWRGFLKPPDKRGRITADGRPVTVLLLRLLDHPGPAIHPLIRPLIESVTPHRHDKLFAAKMLGGWKYSTDVADIHLRQRCGYWLRSLLVRYRFRAAWTLARIMSYGRFKMEI